VLLEILLVWIVGIPALAVGAATMLARRRERLMGSAHVIHFHRVVARSRRLPGSSRRGASSRLRFPAA
jgi:hypothetical protein